MIEYRWFLLIALLFSLYVRAVELDPGDCLLVCAASEVQPLPTPTPLPTPEPTPPPIVDNGELPDIGPILRNPYYGERQPDIMERVCGPLDEWPEVHIESQEDAGNIRRTLKDLDRAKVMVHNFGMVVQPMNVSAPNCVAVIGVDAPIVSKITATASARKAPRQGGLYVADLEFDMYRYDIENGERTSGDCLGMPNNQQFVIVDNVVGNSCTHHFLITSRATTMYMQITNSEFRHGYSHLLYIDSVAYAHIENVKAESPGWGHAVRCIAGVCDIENVQASNINLDGTISYVHPPGSEKDGIKPRYGMHPMEVYSNGGEHFLKNIRLDFYRSRDFRGSSMAFHYRVRDAQWGASLINHDGVEWNRPVYGSKEWLDATPFFERRLTIENLEVNCLTDERGSLPNCHAITSWGSHPIANDFYKDSLKRWLRANDFVTWEDMLAALPFAGLPYPVEWYQWTLGQVLPQYEDNILRGQVANKTPVRPHPSNPGELGVVEIYGLQCDNCYEDVIRPQSISSEYCWTELVDGECLDRRMPNAVVNIYD